MAVEIRLTVKDDGSATISKVTGELKKMEAQTAASATGIEGALGKMRAHWVEFTAATTGAAIALSTAWDMAKRGAEFEENFARLNRQAGAFHVSADRIVGDLQRVTNGQLSAADATRLASRALAIGADAEQVNVFAQAADALSDVLGTGLAPAYEQILQAVATGRGEVLANIGVFVDLDAAMQRLAKSTGRTTDQITKQEKAMLAAKAITEQAGAALNKLSDGAVSDADKLAAVEARFDNITLALSRLAKQAVVTAMNQAQAKVELAKFFGGPVVDLFQQGIGEGFIWNDPSHRAAQEAAGHAIVQEAIGKRIVEETHLAEVQRERAAIVVAAEREEALGQQILIEGIVKATEESRGMKIVTETLAQHQRDAARAARTHTDAIKEQAQTASEWGVAFKDSADLAAGGVERVNTELEELGNRHQEAYSIVTGQPRTDTFDRPLNRPHTTPSGPNMDRPPIGGIGPPLDVFSLTPTPAGSDNAGAPATSLSLSGAGWNNPLVDLSFAGSLPSFDVGTPYVPRDMVAQVHRGEAIVPAAENRAGLGGHTFVFNLYGMTDEQFVRDRLLPLVREALVMKGRR